ncbi:CAP domain-containing protein [Gottfriedia acidiceleris]|uniref:CAP domain-containing protein n=1 Tax=Gottfriedia acidiceleris TaxID=371036 RepID=A0ABY4JH35_9BACI|nr:CAP domain-containing protein [Gottfriedia acidiceleris]UPM53126.1 CAP domain-containing protein [Gottfriedia acidiceleris]
MNKNIKKVTQTVLGIAIAAPMVLGFGSTYAGATSGAVTATKVAVKEKASNRAKTVGYLAKNQKINYSGYNSSFVKVSYKGKTRYILKKYVKYVPPTSTTPSNSTTTTSNPSKPASSNASIQQQILDLVNIERGKGGLKPLTLSSYLNGTAQAWSQTMSNANNMYHSTLSFKGGYKGENIAHGQTTAKEVMTDWMNSPGHRANIMNANFKQLGVGKVGTYWTQQFTD